MIFEYEVKVSLEVTGVKPEEIAIITKKLESNNKIESIVRIEPEYEYDYEGCPYRSAGTYSILFCNGTIAGLETSEDIVEYGKRNYEDMREIEEILTK